MTADLIIRLRAALDDREATARAAKRGSDGTWRPDDFPYPCSGRIVDSAGVVVVYDEGAPSEEQARHIAAHDPAFVLADIAAKRAILDDAEAARAEWEEDTHDHERGSYSSALDSVVELLAEAYGITEDGPTT